MLLILPEAKVISFEEKAFEDAEGFAAPVDEIGEIVSGEESAGFGCGEHVDRRSGAECPGEGEGIFRFWLWGVEDQTG